MALRGYAPWEPKDETAYWIGKVEEVLEEYWSYLPISLRTVFYRLVAEHGFEKTEAAYNRLGTWVARARRAQMLRFDGLRDDQGKAQRVMAFDGLDGFMESVEDQFRHYRRKRMSGQPVRIEMWSEATGVSDQLRHVAWEYGIPVHVSRGFASVTNTHAVAERALKFDGPTVVLHVGDHDPSGVSIYESLIEDARAFLIQKRTWAGSLKDDPDGNLYYDEMDASGPTIRPVRVALTAAQVEEYGIETAPPKRSDSRSASWEGETAQAEALPPDLLERLVKEAIEAELDMDRLREEIGKEDEDREQIRAILDRRDE